MDRPALLQHLGRELAGFRRCLGGDLSAAVKHCHPWTLHDLAEHMGRGNLWAAAAVTEGRGDHEPDPAPRDPAALLGWFDETTATLLAALDTDPASPAWTFHPPRTVGFWQRRRCLETLVHRWDAEHALGETAELDPALAGAGVAEVFDTFAPRQVTRGRAKPPQQALRLTATDTGRCWTYGPGDPVATVSGTAEQLLLALWQRLPSESAALHWTGDQDAGQRVLNSPLVV